MYTKHKIPGFTLSEMIIVLIITSIVVGIAFSVLSLVQKHMHGIKRNFNHSTVLQRFEQSIWIDFNRYGSITYHALDDTLICASEMDSVTYRFTSSSIIKERDTFWIPLEYKMVFMDGIEKGNGLIDALKLKTSQSFSGETLFVYKGNDANQFMN